MKQSAALSRTPSRVVNRILGQGINNQYAAHSSITFASFSTLGSRGVVQFNAVRPIVLRSMGTTAGGAGEKKEGEAGTPAAVTAPKTSFTTKTKDMLVGVAVGKKFDKIGLRLSSESKR